jgi:hypothetical protein
MDDGFTDRCNRCSAKRRRIGTSLTNRTPFIAVRSRNAGSTGRGVMLCGALPTESNLVFSRLQGERRRIWLEGRIRHSPALLRKRLTNVSLATGDRHARTHTCHRWPVCCCYPVVKELRTQRRCAGPPFKFGQTKRPGCWRDPGPGPFKRRWRYALAPPPGSNMFVSRFIGCLCSNAPRPAFSKENARELAVAKRHSELMR